jgi:Protein of unknown function (DUF998)
MASVVQAPGIPGWAVASAALAPVVLTVGWLVADLLQPASYSPVRDTVSSLAGHSGVDTWIMTWAMLLAGGAYLISAAGMSGLAPPARLLLVQAGLCSIGIAASPIPAAGPSLLHLAATTVGALTIMIWPATATWRTGVQLPAIVNARSSAVVTMAFAAMLAWVLFEIRYGDLLGVAERATASIQTTWPFVVGWTWRRSSAGRAAAPGVPAPAIHVPSQPR